MIETTAFQGLGIFHVKREPVERCKTGRHLKHKNETSQHDKSNFRSFATAIDESFWGGNSPPVHRSVIRNDICAGTKLSCV